MNSGVAVVAVWELPVVFLPLLANILEATPWPMEFPNEFCDEPDILCKFALCPPMLGIEFWVRPDSGGSADDNPAEF